ncbi:MAG: hypothetical protein AB8G05_18065 [Oligoflexales bacterium]
MDKRRISVSLSFCFFFNLIACGDEKDGYSIGAPQVEPPVTRNMPDGMTTSASLKILNNTDLVNKTDEDGAATSDTMVSTIKNYLYPTNGGPSPIARLKSVDERMTSLDARAQDSARACLEDSASEYTIAAAMPSGESITYKFQCNEKLNETAELAFGLDDTNFYLIDKTGSSTEEGIYVAANALKDGTSVDVWTVGYQANPTDHGASGPSANVMHVKGSDTSGIEVTTAGTLGGYSLSCGVHFRSNETYIYIEGQLSIGGSCTTNATYCMDASTLVSTDIANCTGAGLNTFELQTITLEAVTENIANIVSIVDSKIEGFTEFNKDASD